MSYLLCAFRKERPEIEPGNPAHGVVRVKKKRTSVNAPLMQPFRTANRRLRLAPWPEHPSGRDSVPTSLLRHLTDTPAQPAAR